ncbi:MAG: Uncharacterized protein XD92_0524 [Proteiniphilum acetatigenes]|uniref:Uncharacterized protein n=1 Tax=Proteiniphilum acetatigenes TaxID=294710 RepID=A0A117M0S6_9BACT|nr:MAG: Uncharacterized protein XD92_0524 [Proteiniphilum acetatigenes]
MPDNEIGTIEFQSLTSIANSSMPFYKFGELLYLKKIETEEWIPFIRRRIKLKTK